MIAGPENGPHKRPCDPAWIKALADECAHRHIAFFDKRDPIFDDDYTRREWPEG